VNDARVMVVLIVFAVLFGMALAIAGSRRP
jgi:hypothetical protein